MTPKDFQRVKEDNIAALRVCIEDVDRGVSGGSTSDYARTIAIRKLAQNQKCIMKALVFLLEDKI